MSEIWSISLTSEGIGACALNLEMASRRFSAPWPEMRYAGSRAVSCEDVCSLLAQALTALMCKSIGSDIPLALAVTTPEGETAMFADKFGAPLSPICLSEPLLVPRHEIPDCYAADPAAASAYRTSLLRRLRQNRPELCMNARPGILSLGAYAAARLTHIPGDVCLAACLPSQYPDIPDTLAEAAGYSREYSMKRLRCGFPFGRIIENLSNSLHSDDTRLNDLTGVPVFHMGSSDGARALAAASDPAAWSVSIGGRLRSQWIASVGAISGYEIAVVPHRTENYSKIEDTACAEENIAESADNKILRQTPPLISDTDTSAPDKSLKTSENTENNAQDNNAQEMTRDDWTRHIHALQPLQTWPGPRKTQNCYGYASSPMHSPILAAAIQACMPDSSGRIRADRLASVPVGSGGLHIISAPEGLKIIGLNDAHTPNHLVRALFESQIFTLRDWFENTIQSASGPMRLTMNPPWPHEAAQYAADILGMPVCLIENGDAKCAALGAAIALIRDLELPAAAPKITASIIEPSQRTAYYSLHYAVHQALAMQN